MEKRRIRYLDKYSSSLEGKHYLITGSSSGIGLECAKSLLCKGAEVTFMVRNKEKAEKCIEVIEMNSGIRSKRISPFMTKLTRTQLPLASPLCPKQVMTQSC